MKGSNNSKTILVIVVGFLIIYFFLKRENLLFKDDYLLFIIIGIGLLSFFVDYAIIWLWDKIAHILGWINTRVLLSLVFFLFLTPIALLRKLFSKKDPLKLKNTQTSTFVDRNHTYVSKDLENIW